MTYLGLRVGMSINISKANNEPCDELKFWWIGGDCWWLFATSKLLPLHPLDVYFIGHISDIGFR
jgi:hypothetical protein